ncbi:MAG: HDOD domain-containing protein [Planctomycetaceae bacterium]|nr:HDOD domain-containing protein [Planctomycetaceae bacterium]
MADAIDWAKLREDGIGRLAVDALPPTLKLPALPLAVTKFTEKAGDPDVRMRDLAAVIETDTGLTTELLRHVNSAYHGLRNKAGTVCQAMTLLGLRPAKTFVLATGVQAAVRARQSKLINQTCFWNASLQRALFAREVASLLKIDGETAFAGALLQDFLLPVLTNELFDHYLDFSAHRESQPALLCEYEQKRLGWDHALAGASLAHRWHLPDELVCCVLMHHMGLRALAHPQLKRTSVAAVALSALLPDQLRQDYSGMEQLLLLEEKWPLFKLRSLIEAVDAKHGEMAIGVKNDFPLAVRCQAIFNSAIRTADDYRAACQDGSLNRVALAG